MRDGRFGSWAARWRPEIALVVLVLVVTGPVVQVLMAHQASRLAFTGAVVDHGTVRIDAYEAILGVDFAERDGHLYSDKAPGQPLLAAPAYGIARAVGAEPAETERYFGNLTLWWTSLWSAAVPLAVLAVVVRRFSLRVVRDPAAATAAAVAISLGTLLLPFGTVLFGHVLAAALCFGAYVLAREPDARAPRLAVAGLLGGLAVLTEYTSGIVVVVVGVLALLRHRAKVAAYVAGGLPAVAMLGVYNTLAWGSATAFSYESSATFADFHAQGLFGIGVPAPALTAQVLVGERGLLTLTPVVLVGLVGLVGLARRRDTREVGVVGLVVFGLFVAVQGGWFSVTAGASPGPRYVVPALPFVAVGIAAAWRWSRGAVIVGTILGAIPMLLAILTNPLAQPTETFTAGHWVWRALEGNWGRTLLSPWLADPWPQVVHITSTVLALAAVCWATVTAGRPEPAVLPAAAEPARTPGGDPTPSSG